jgi:hypothetical protein
MSLDSDQVAVMLEAIKAKNALVVERFKYSYEACQSVTALAINVDAELALFRKKAPKTDGTPESRDKFVAVLKSEFHPVHYRQLLKLRSKFESTNDLLSGYSTTLTPIIHISMLERIIEEKHYYSASAISRTYRGLWTFYAEIITSLVRLTSNDLRFWLTDCPYVVHAENWARRELESAQEFLLASDWGGKRFHLSIETAEGLDEFWKGMSSNKLK